MVNTLNVAANVKVKKIGRDARCTSVSRVLRSNVRNVSRPDSGYAQLPRLLSVADESTKGKIKDLLVKAAETGGHGLIKQTALDIRRLIEHEYVITEDSNGDRRAVELPDGPVVFSTKAFEQMVAILAGL